MGKREHIYEIIAENIRKERRRLGITQAELAERADVSLDTIKSVENGRRAMSLDTYLNIVHALESSPMVLMSQQHPEKHIERFAFMMNRCAVITILKTILKADNVVYMLISAVIFAMFHINSLKQSGFMPEISNLLIYFILGMGCAYVYLRTNNIVSAIVLHMFWNVSIVGGIISGIAHR